MVAITTEQMLITPEMALDWLTSCNTHNRVVRPNGVHEIVEIIKRGEWQMTHQGIAFSDKDVLLDGQHRLLAIVETNTPVPMLVTRGLKEETFQAIDRGIKRNVGDALSMPQRVTSVLSIFARLNGLFSSNPTPPQVLAMNPYFGDLVRELEGYAPGTARRVSSVHVRSAVVLRAAIGDKEWCFQSYRDLVGFRFESMPSVIQGLARQMLAPKSMSQAETLVRAWAAFDKSRSDNLRPLVRGTDNGLEEMRSAISLVIRTIDNQQNPGAAKTLVRPPRSRKAQEISRQSLAIQ